MLIRASQITDHEGAHVSVDSDTCPGERECRVAALGKLLDPAESNSGVRTADDDRRQSDVDRSRGDRERDPDAGEEERTGPWFVFVVNFCGRKICRTRNDTDVRKLLKPV